MGWFEERKAKKAAAKQAAAQAAQAAKDEKRRQEELQEQQTVSYVIGCITELENMKGAGDRKAYENIARRKEELIKGMGTSPRVQAMAGALEKSLSAAEQRIGKAEKQESSKEIIRKERGTPLETLIRKEQDMEDGGEFKPQGEAIDSTTDLEKEEKVKLSRKTIAKEKFKSIPSSAKDAIKESFSGWSNALNTIYDKLTGTMDTGAGASGIGGDSSDIQDMEDVMSGMTDMDKSGAGITGAVFSGISSILKCVKVGITIGQAIYKSEESRKGETTMDNQERFQIIRGLLHDAVDLINGFAGALGPLTKAIPFYNSILGIVGNGAGVLADMTEVVANSIFCNNMRKRCKMLYDTMMEKKAKYTDSGDTDAASAYTVKKKSKAIDTHRRQLLGKIVKENQDDDSVGGKIQIVKSSSLRSRNDSIYREGQYGLGARIQALDEKLRGGEQLTQEERTRLKSQKRQLEAMEIMEEYREADKAHKKMSKALAHNVEDIIKGGTNVVASGLKLAGEAAAATGVGAAAGAGLYAAGMATGIAESSYEIARGGGSYVYKSIRTLIGTEDNKATTREDMAISLIERMHEVGSSEVWDDRAKGFKKDPDLEQVDSHQLVRQGRNVDHLHGILRSGLDSTMSDLIGSENRSELKKNIAAAFGQGD